MRQVAIDAFFLRVDRQRSANVKKVIWASDWRWLSMMRECGGGSRVNANATGHWTFGQWPAKTVVDWPKDAAPVLVSRKSICSQSHANGALLIVSHKSQNTLNNPFTRRFYSRIQQIPCAFVFASECQRKVACNLISVRTTERYSLINGYLSVCVF